MRRGIFCVWMGLIFVLGFTVFASAATINYTENFQKTGVQATSDNTVLAKYPAWTYHELAVSAGDEVRVDTAGTLTLFAPGTATATYATYVQIPVSAITGGPTSFDFSSVPVNISMTLGGTGPASWISADLILGCVVFDFFPGYGVVYLSNNKLGTYYLQDSLGWTPEAGTPYTFKISIVEDTKHVNYNVTYSVSGPVGGVQQSYSNSVPVPISEVSAITDIRLNATENIAQHKQDVTLFFGNFSVTQGTTKP